MNLFLGILGDMSLVIGICSKELCFFIYATNEHLLVESVLYLQILTH